MGVLEVYDTITFFGSRFQKSLKLDKPIRLLLECNKCDDAIRDGDPYLVLPESKEHWYWKCSMEYFCGAMANLLKAIGTKKGREKQEVLKRWIKKMQSN